MALVLKDRVKQDTTTAGTGTITLSGTYLGYQSFSAIGNGNTTYYCIAGQGTNEWEVGIGTYTAAGTTLSRDTILASSNSGSVVTFSAGTKDVFVVYPAGKSVYQDASGNVGIGTGFPGARIDVNSAIAFTARFSGPANTYIEVTDGTGSFKAQLISNSPFLTSVGSYPLLLGTNNTERIRVDTSGNVGLGTASPANRLDIVNSAAGAQMTIAGSDGQYAGMFGGTGSVGPGIFFLNTAPALRFGTGTAKSLGTFTELMRLDASGNLGLGVTPSAWASGWRALQSLGGNSFYTDSTVSALASNAIYDGAWKYVASSGAGTYQINRNAHTWFNAASGTAGNAITFTIAMTLNASGNLGVGITSPAQRLDVLGSGQFRPAATQDAVLISGRAGGTSSYAATITPTTLTANRTITLPDATTTVVGTDATQTLTNKRVNPRAVAAAATTGSLTPNGDTTDVYNAFGLTGAITLLTPSGTPADGQRLMLRFEDNGTARGITWTTTSGAFRAVGITLPTTTVASKVTYVGCVYNSTDVFWDAVATVTQA